MPDNKLEEYYAALRSIGVGEASIANHRQAVADSRACAAGLSPSMAKVQRMLAYIQCRRAKKYGGA